MSLSEYLEKQRQAQTDEDASNTVNDYPGDLALPAAMPPAADKPAEPGLLFRLWNRKLWAFPWSHFVEAEYYPANADGGMGDSAEQIRIIFASREIMLDGRNLEALMKSVVRHRVVEIREVPEKFAQAGSHDESAPVVRNVEIRPREK